ncbi:MAG: NHL repeat-containing protein, partial [Xanthomonadales bacterium]|nr:NHL repeat-containing protein [Xanthomonadales bacterium]
LLRDWTEIDWCGFYDATVEGLNFYTQPKKGETNRDKLVNGQSATFYRKHFKLLLTFINDDNNCEADWEHDPDMLGVEHNPRLLLRLASATDGSGEIYITDPLVGSLFIYDASMNLVAELKDLDKPLGVAVDSGGYILVGNDGRDNVEVYDPYNGNMLALFGQGLIIMPNSVTTGPDGNIYVTDSRSHRVWVFDADYNFIRSIGSPGEGENELYFPVDTEVITLDLGGEPIQQVFVADQGNERIQIFDTNGYFLGRIEPGECGMSGCEPPLLANLQALDVDAYGRLHVLDNFEAVVSILDPLTGDYLGEYGQFGEGPGYLRVPYGLVISEMDQPIVTSGDGARVVVYPPQ